jgi:hypothetical protein
MKLKNAISSALIAVGCLTFASASFAATCASTLGPIAASGPQSGNSCGNNTNFAGSFALCGGVGFSSTGTDAWAVTVGAGQNFTFSVTSSAFVPDIALLANSCADNASCVGGTDYEGAAGAPSTATSAAVTGQTAGTYYLIVTDSTATGAQCGAYSLSIAGTLPVKLQDFSVQ